MGLGFIVDLNVYEVDFKVEIGLEIELKIGKNYFQIELKNSEKMMRMTWLLTWLNVSVATLNVTLQLLVIYRLKSNLLTIEAKKSEHTQTPNNPSHEVC